MSSKKIEIKIKVYKLQTVNMSNTLQEFYKAYFENDDIKIDDDYNNIIENKSSGKYNKYGFMHARAMSRIKSANKCSNNSQNSTQLREYTTKKRLQQKLANKHNLSENNPSWVSPFYAAQTP